MKRQLALGAVVAAVALMGSLDSARADHCSSYSQGYGYSSNSYYTPNYSYQPRYNHQQVYSHGSYGNYGNYGGYYRPSYGHSYVRPGFSISIGSGRSLFSFGSSFGNSGHRHSSGGHRH
ncbi:MAG: hypothetical protein O3B13_16410 [Planctomycetota bacterium]|nr:hypothetical protein [Planctomycetota bacterium]MDA1164675.1 hypothetical protein [Planctomycetota bacterium]